MANNTPHVIREQEHDMMMSFTKKLVALCVDESDLWEDLIPSNNTRFSIISASMDAATEAIKGALNGSS